MHFFLTPWFLEVFPSVATNMPKCIVHLLVGRKLSLWQINGTRMKLYLFYLNVMGFLPKWLWTDPNNRSRVSLIIHWNKLTSTWDRQSPTHRCIMPLREPSVRPIRVHRVKLFVLDIPRSYGITVLNWKTLLVQIIPLTYIWLMVTYHKLS